MYKKMSVPVEGTYRDPEAQQNLCVCVEYPGSCDWIATMRKPELPTTIRPPACSKQKENIRHLAEGDIGLKRQRCSGHTGGREPGEL